MTDIDTRDITALRQQGDLGNYLRQAREQEAKTNAEHKRLVYRHPNLIDRLRVLGQDPWNGRIPPAEWGGAINTSPIRAALIEIVTEAEQRTTTARSAA
ncbi:hypothetical protein [Streptomyces purpureus]|uniref:Uncharacterized protein n=1 Tax=Streptomyces purpureus TaxID=1951 RepID=A0A918H6Y9_9ACTN|nr:hypothetical protein [Streptomyces purpureus]GGT43547.1 hypothetical protein GCM10014713_41580 [Streptomyces purpureus]